MQADGRADQDADIGSRAALGFPGLFVRDERVCREGQHFIEDEERKHVPGKRDPHGAGYSDGEAHVETCLLFLAVTPHVANGIKRIDDPEAGCDAGEQHTQRLDFEGNLETRHNLQQAEFRTGTGHNGIEQGKHDREEGNRRQKRHAFS